MKILKFIALFLLSLCGLTFIANALSSEGHLIDYFKELIIPEYFTETLPEHKSDDMLLDDGKFYIQLNESNARNHLNSDVSIDLKDIHDSILKKFKDDEVDPTITSFEMYIQLQTDTGKKMFISSVYNLDEAGNLNNCNYKWYDEKTIFSNVFNNYTSGVILRAYDGTSLDVIDVNLYANIILSNDNLYYDVESTEKEYLDSNSVYSFGNSVFDSLFTVGQTVEDEVQTTYIMNIDPTILEQYLDGSMEYNYASDTVYDIYQNNYSSSLDEENDFLQAIACEYSYQNPTTLDILKFYVILNINKDYAGVYYYYKGSYECLYYNSPKDNKYYENNKVLFDMSNFETYIDHEDGYAICNFIREASWNSDGILTLNANTDFIYFTEGDLPLEFTNLFN